jgi:hypothetical protein
MFLVSKIIYRSSPIRRCVWCSTVHKMSKQSQLSFGPPIVRAAPPPITAPVIAPPLVVVPALTKPVVVVPEVARPNLTAAEGATISLGSEEDDIPMSTLGKKRARSEVIANAKPPSKRDASVSSSDDEEVEDETVGGGKSKLKAVQKDNVAGTSTIAGVASEYHPLRAADWCPSGVPGSSRVPYAALVKV